MAKYYNGFAGPFYGRLGSTVGYEWKGKFCMRSVGAVRNPRTRQQQAGRRVFSVTSHLASTLSDATKLGLRGMAADAKTSEHNMFVKLNRHYVNLVDNEVEIDYPSIRVAAGTLAGVLFGTPQVTAGRTVTADFSTAEGMDASYGDYVYLFAYCPTLEQGFLSQPAKRYSGHVSDTLPQCWSGQRSHLYGFVWDTDLTASDSTYLGIIEVA